MELFKIIGSLVVGAFLAGIGVITFLDNRIEEKVESHSNNAPPPAPAMYEIYEVESQEVQSSWVSNDAQCRLTCPTGFVVKQFGYENPNSASDCGIYECIKLGIRLAQ